MSRQWDGSDILLLVFGFIGAIGFGATAPAFCVIFGEMLDDMGMSASSDNGIENLKWQAKVLVIIGVYAWIVAFFMVSFYALFGERITFKTRIAYFSACLNKDSAYYDEQNPNEMASKIAKECATI